jgi:tetratricopeptide (TPR) repeat protein
MANVRTKIKVTLLLALLGSQTGWCLLSKNVWADWSYRQEEITAKQAGVLEEALKTNPDDLSAHEQLITYYFMARLKSRDPDVEKKREEHIFWLIEHHPDSDLAGSPESSIEPVGLSESTEEYQHGKQLWMQQVELHPNNKKILRNAAQFFLFWDRKLSRELLEKAWSLDSSDTATSSSLAQTYMLDGEHAKSPEDKAALAQKALSVRERALEGADREERFNSLDDLATEALEAGDTTKAEQYASEVLKLAPEFRNSWNYGNAVHKGNIMLGRIALLRGDVAAADQHLLAAGQTPGSPQLNSFGPNMSLAKELLERGERDTVLTYLQSCAKFWKMHGPELQEWIAKVKAGETPDFGANLLY